MLKKAALLFSSNVVHSALLFLRNILVARLIGVEDYGIAATFAIAMAVVELATQLGLHQLIVQDSRGEEDRFQGAMQGIHLLRSLVMSVALVILAPTFATFLNIPDVAWAFQILAVAILARGFMHFDVYRLQREMEFAPQIVMQVVSPLVALLAVFPFAWAFGDFRVMLYSLILQEIIQVVISHGVAKRRYRLALDLPLMLHAFRFGWPLMLNGLFMFALFHGERVIVAREFDLLALGLFSMAMTVTLTPGMTFSRTYTSLLLPWFSAVKDDQGQFRNRVYYGIEGAVVMGLVFAGFILVVLTPIILLLVGDKYGPMIYLMPWLTIGMAIRLFRTGPTLAALATAQTRVIMLTTFIRISILPVAWWYVAVHGGDVISIILFGILGELMSLAAAVWVLSRRVNVPLLPAWRSLVTGLLCLGTLAIHEYSIWMFEGELADPLMTKAIVVVVFGITLFASRRVIGVILEQIRLRVA